MRTRLISLCFLSCAVAGVSVVATHDVPTATSDAYPTNDDRKFKIARSVSARTSIAPTHYVASTLRGGSRAAALITTSSDRILKEEGDKNREEKNGQGQVEECDKDCEKVRKEDEKAKEKAEKEAEKAAEEAAKEAEEAAKDAAKAAEKENQDFVEESSTEDEPETIAQDTTTTTTPKADGQGVATDIETPAEAEKDEEEPEAAGTDGSFVVVVPPKSVKEDLGDGNKAVLPSPAEENTIFDITTETEGTTTTTTTMLENEGSGISSSSQNNEPTAVDVSINNGDGFPGPFKTDEDSGLIISSSSSGSSRTNDDSLQPLGKALLSVALSGVFVAFVAVFLLRRPRRSSISDPANALAITPYSPSKDESYFVDRDESYDETSDVEKQILPVDTAASSSAPTPEKISSTAHDHEDGNDDADAADGESDIEDESSQSVSLSFSENASKFLSMLPCQLDISPCSKPTMLEASTDDLTSVPLPPDLRVVAAPSTTSEVEGEESEENFVRNNTARELMRKYKMDDVSVNKYLCPSPLISSHRFANQCRNPRI